MKKRHLLEFLKEAFRCHVHHYQCLAVPVQNQDGQNFNMRNHLEKYITLFFVKITTPRSIHVTGMTIDSVHDCEEVIKTTCTVVKYVLDVDGGTLLEWTLKK